MTDRYKDLGTAFDVIVVGGGHAGTEAAAAAARLGVKVALVTHDVTQIGAMSCNPAIGGLGKGHLVREIDALDGIMGRAADLGGIQFRVLNRRKGPAVQGPRAQADRKLYARAVQGALSTLPNLAVIAAEVTELSIERREVTGIRTARGSTLSARSVVITSGTFLRGMIHIGSKRIPAGRVGEAPAIRLAEQFAGLGLVAGRLKTGTPARLDGKSIDWSALEMQAGDDPPEAFSTMTDSIVNPQISCGITRTTEAMHALIRENIHQSAMYSGSISGRGPRYCPSIEDKVVRFADRDSHQVFLEPEGLDDDTVYPNGISTSLPEEVQEAMIRLMPGLADVRIIRPGYAIEYDFCDPTGLKPTLETKSLGGLFLAGQINGTTGYEEAAAQGLVAGLNAARKAGAQDGVVFERENSYIGVLVDDLVTRGVNEPYRMFTSRSEYRLQLRSDNADIRLTDWGYHHGLVGRERWLRHLRKMGEYRAARQLLDELSVTPTRAASQGLKVNMDGVRRSAFALLSQPDISWDTLVPIWPELAEVPGRIAQILQVDARYAVYLERQSEDIERVRRDAALSLEGVVSFSGISGLSNELQTKLNSIRPRNVAHAGRIEGMTPAALALLASRAMQAARRAE